jgi:hypothetical protein
MIAALLAMSPAVCDVCGDGLRVQLRKIARSPLKSGPSVGSLMGAS